MIVVLSVAFLAVHLPYLPQSLEDLDSINFALGVRQFDVARHQPHPPGYPVFILIAKAVHAVVPSEASALALVSVGGGALGALAVAALFRRIDEPDTPLRWRVAPVAVAMTAPLYWFTAVRPLSDSSGLAAALAVQAMTLAAGSPRTLAIAAFGAGVATGIRSQVAWLTVPLLIFAGFSPRPLALMALAFGGGALLWFAPLVVLTGGPTAYWHALFEQGAEDLGNIMMLWNNHGARDLMDAGYYAFVAPWGAWPVAAVVISCAVAGVLRLARVQPRALAWLAIAFGPYLVFDLLFQETFTGRYALPLIVPAAYLAVAGLRLLPWDTGLAIAVALAMFSAHVGGTSIAAFSRAKAPAFRLLDDMRAAAPSLSQPPVLAMDRRESLDLRRPMMWAGEAMPPARVLPAPPQHEWLEAVNYWNGGGRAPVWFVVDPIRTSIDLVQHADPVRYRWPLPYPVLLSGVRPNEMDWYRVDRPEWYVGEGWALTPEAAGVANADRRGLAYGPIDGWASRKVLGGVMMIGGRNLEPTTRPHLTVTFAGAVREDVVLPPGPFLRFVGLPFVDADRPLEYFKISVEASPASRVAVEQFDASAARSMVGFGDGWHEQEFNPRTGVRWRWLSEQGTLRMRLPLTRISLDRRQAPEVVLHLEGESPLTYFPRGSMLTVRSGWRVQLTRLLNSDFALDIPITDLGPAGGSDMTLQTDQTYVPAERSSRTQDRRHLGLRIFKAELRTVKPPAS